MTWVKLKWKCTNIIIVKPQRCRYEHSWIEIKGNRSREEKQCNKIGKIPSKTKNQNRVSHLTVFVTGIFLLYASKMTQTLFLKKVHWGPACDMVVEAQGSYMANHSSSPTWWLAFSFSVSLWWCTCPVTNFKIKMINKHSFKKIYCCQEEML